MLSPYQTILDCFDPGNITGAARFIKGQLSWASKYKFEELMIGNPYASYDRRIVLIELPEIYKVEFMKGDPNDLIGLAVKAGEIKQYHGSNAEVQFVLPKQWKGQASKKVTMNRAKKSLTEYEKSIVRGEDHNMWDAIALGLWKLGRL